VSRPDDPKPTTPPEGPVLIGPDANGNCYYAPNIPTPCPGETGITGKPCHTYPAYPGCVPKTHLPRTSHEGTAFTGADISGTLVAFLVFAVVGLSVLGSLRAYARTHFVRRG
jgi:hypothetical protein